MTGRSGRTTRRPPPPVCTAMTTRTGCDPEMLCDPKVMRREVSQAGRQVLAAAVSIDHDGDLRKLIAVVEDLADDDLDGGYLRAHHLKEAVAWVRRIRTCRQ